jgi:hypothetical protein
VFVVLQFVQIAGMIWRFHEKEQILLVCKPTGWQLVPVHITIVENDIAVMKGAHVS